MQDIDIKSLRSWARTLSRRYDMSTYREDLVQESALRMIQGRKSPSGPMQDFMRSEMKWRRFKEGKAPKFVKIGFPAKFRATCPQHAILELPSISILEERRREVVRLRYWEGKTLSQIGKIMGFNESRASQLHSEAIRSLRKAMEHA